MNFVLSLFFLLVFSSCGAKKSTKSSLTSNNVINRYFVQGDPLQLIEGTKLNKSSFLNLDNYKEFNQFGVAGISYFSDISLVQEKERATVESGNESASEDETTKPKLEFSWTKRKGFYSYGNSNYKLYLNFVPDSKNGLQLKSFESNKLLTPVTNLHHSVSLDKSKMSFLFHFNEEGTKTLMNISLYKNLTKKQFVPVLEEHRQSLITDVRMDNLKYIFGPGVRVPWLTDKKKRKIRIDVCPSLHQAYSFKEIEKSFKKWETPFQANPFEIEVIAKNECAPFSDVNEHGVYLVTSYLTEDPRTPYANPAATFIVADLNDRFIYDADILVYFDEIKKMGTYPVLGTKTNRTLTHEMGHFLGLDHNFDNSFSVMSYKDIFELDSYDASAIRYLYH